MKKEKKAKVIKEDPDEILKKVGVKMARIRKELGYKNGDYFAYDKGINRSQYGKYEAGSQDMRFSTLIRTINLLGLTVEEFFSQGLE